MKGLLGVVEKRGIVMDMMVVSLGKTLNGPIENRYALIVFHSMY